MPILGSRGAGAAAGFGLGGAALKYSLEYMVVGGGAGGGGCYGGSGGGAGGYRVGTYAEVSASEVYTITVGAGGAAAPTQPQTGGNGSDGSNSILSNPSTGTISSQGGGKGVSYRSPLQGSPLVQNGGNGGSGGGGSSSPSGPAGTGGTGNTPSVAPSQGNDGGAGTSAGGGSGGGGGGGSEAGQDAQTTPLVPGGGKGGDGGANSITGSSVYYAGGGGGSGGPGRGAGAGGNGGGGAGANGAYASPLPNSAGVAGTANTGGGGGGAAYDIQPGQTSGAGGSGVVVIKVPTKFYPGTSTGSPTVTTSGPYTILKFTGNGSYTT